MSASDEVFEFHLTPTGWKRGSQKIDFSGWTHVDPPADRLITASFNEYLSSGFSKLELSVDVEKHAEGRKILAALKAHGAAPKLNAGDYTGWPQFLVEIGYSSGN